MAGYLGAIPVPQATQHRESFTATSGQTTFATAGYTAGFLDVYLNGSHLSPADFTATNGSDVVLASGASAGDVCDIISYTAFEVNSQTFTGGLDVTGGITADGLVVSAASANIDVSDTGTSHASQDFLTNSNAARTTIGVERSSGGGLFVGSSAYAAVFGSAGAHSTQIVSNNTVRMTVDSSGNVGIGTSSPDNSLEIDNSSNYQLRLKGAGSAFAELGIDDNNRLRIYSNGAERMRIDSSGRVGIGTSSPSALMHISGGSTATDGIHYIATNTSNGPAGIVMNSGHGNWKIINSQTVANALEFIDGGSPDATRMMIDSSGNVLVGGTNTNPIGNHVSQVIMNAANGTGIHRDGGTPFKIGTDGNRAIQIMHINGTDVGSIDVSGSSTSYTTSSDYRLKTDAQPMSGASDRVLALNPVNFEWITDGTRVDGFLAHEAQAVVPESVTGTKDAMMDEEYQVSAATGDIYTAGVEAGFNEVSAAIEASPAYYDVDGNIIKAEVIAQAAVHEAYDAVDEVIHSADVEQPETLADGQQWRETKSAVMGTRSVPDMQGIDQSKMVPLLTAALREALARITALENA